VWYRDCRHQVAPDPGAMAERYGAELSAIATSSISGFLSFARREAGGLEFHRAQRQRQRPGFQVEL
jgi:hypothetical protein